MTSPSSTNDHRLFSEIILTGDWQVHPIALDARDVLQKATDEIAVPDSAHLQPVLYPDRPYWGEHLRAINHQAWIYRRTFTTPADVHFRRARLRFDGVDYFASVWLNGQFVGEHEGSFAPFALDVTRFLIPNAENTLVVRVTSPWDAPNPKGSYPIDHVIRGLVKGHYEHGEGVIPPDVNPIGIWRPVALLLDDGISLDRFRIRTQLDGRVDLQVTCTNATADSWDGTLDLRIVAENHDGGGLSHVEVIQLPPGTHQLDYALQIAEPRLWWSWDHGDPNLYRLQAALSDGSGAVISERGENFGVRTVRLERSPKRFTYYLNERPIFIRGTSYMPGLYLAQCDHELLARDVAIARETNLNLLRVHVHVSPPDLYDLCDREGMLIWQDFELSWVQDTSPAFEARARVLQREMIAMLGNHPSVMTWTCHNEPTMIFTRRQNLEQRPDPALYADALEQDPTRPVFICSGQMESDWRRSGDMHSYYGAFWTKRYTDIYPHFFRLNSEFGFEAPAKAATLKAYPDAWERLKHLEGEIDDLWRYQAELIQFQVEHLRRQRVNGSAGYVHFWFNDLVPQVGCGVLDVNRLPKGGYGGLKFASQPVLIALEHDGRRPVALWIFNDTMKAYPGSEIRWRFLDANWKVTSEEKFRYDITPNAPQRICDAQRMPLPEQCARIILTLYTSQGVLLSENNYVRPFQPMPRPRGYPWKFDRYLGTKVFDRPDAPSLADAGVNRLFKIVPLPLREAIAEWALRQQLPPRFASAVAHVLDRIMT